jgi:cellulose synthase/poly-beta-1,6-N-acetylglucosamine synthase-like glycosyltransferase
MIVALILFWLAVAIIAYTYFLFPVIVFLRGRLWPHPYKSGEITPEVSMIIAAHNEEKSIGAKLDNALSLDYPAEKLRVIVASDGSVDDTNTIARDYAESGVELLELPRVGKAKALNIAVESASGEILVFSDANSIYAADALRALVRPFADPEIGGVAGHERFLSKSGNDLAGAGEKDYWRLDRRLKILESSGGSAISAAGAIYAIRRKLFKPVIEGVTDDFYTSTGVVVQGYRLVYTPDAVAYESVESTRGEEFDRKVRVITRGWQSVLSRRALLNPFRYGFYSLQLFSHKVLRRMIAIPLLMILLASPFLWLHGTIYNLAVLGQLVFYGLAALALPLEGTSIGRLKIVRIPFYFCMVNFASSIAAFNVVRGRQINLWETRRKGENDAVESATGISSAEEKSLV